MELILGLHKLHRWLFMFNSIIISTFTTLASDKGCMSIFIAYSIYTHITGDTLYYKFTSDDSSTTEWGYKLTVTGNKLGR